MVRVAIVALALSGCVAEDEVYYHTQLLQTKVNPQKVSVDTTGEVQDDMALFQKSFSQKLHRRSKEAMQKTFFATMKAFAPPGSTTGSGAPIAGGGGSGGGAGGGGGPQDYSKCDQVGDCFNDAATAEHSDFVGMVCGADDSPNPATCQMVNGDFACMRCGGGGGGATGGPPPPGGGDEPPMDFGPPPPEAVQQCTTYYGDSVDVNKCWSCSMQAFMADTGENWHPDPNVGFEMMCDFVDNCMGQTNHLTAACEENYGEEVGLLDCLFCGMMCECESPLDCDMACHQGCMSNDEEAWEEEEHGDADSEAGVDECRMFYGKDAEADKCQECGDKCFEEAQSSATSEEMFFNTIITCSDECMGQTNKISQSCQEGYGDDVNVFVCFNCGMECGCDAQQCNEVCHGDCMAGPPASMPPTYDALLQASKSGKLKNVNFSAAKRARRLHSGRLFAKNAQLPTSDSTIDTVATSSSIDSTSGSTSGSTIDTVATSDGTDLMQTSKHLK